MSTSATLRGFRPRTPTSYARPVQSEDATLGLCGAGLPNGEGILVWPLANGEIHYAIVSDPKQFIVDDVVPIGDVQTLVTLPATPAWVKTSVFMANGGLYAFVVSRVSDVGKVVLYEADSAANPTSWSVKNTLSNQTAGGPSFTDYHGAPIPLILDDGRWVLVYGAWQITGGSSAFHSMHVKAAYSDDDGTTFNNVVTYEHIYPTPGGFARSDGVALQTAREPTTGDLYFWSGSTQNGPDYSLALWRSEDDGASWTIVNTPTGSWYTEPHLNLFVDNGSKVYAAATSSSTAIYELVGTADDVTDFTDTGESWPAPGVTVSEDTFKAILAGRAVYFFTLDQVMRILAGGWHTGYTGN